MNMCVRVTLCVVVGMMFPFLANAQSGGVADEMNGLHAVLEKLYEEMIPLCSKLIGVGRGIAGFAATWYIAARVWRHIANAEPIDFYPLFRPFVLGFCVLIFPSVLAMLNGVLKPTVAATSEMVKGSDKAIQALLKQKEEELKQTAPWKMYVGESGEGNRDLWYEYTHGNEKEGFFEGIGNDVRFAMAKASYNFRNSVKEWMSEVLRVLFEAASLCIDTLRTFQLVVLAILGPLVFGLAVFDGFQHALTSWLARYINIFLWLPVANIFGSIIGKIQEQMIKLDIAQIQQSGDTFFSSTDIAYIVFLIIGIIGYFTVPSVANYIVHAGGGNALGQKVTSMLAMGGSTVASGGAAAGARMAAGASNIMKTPGYIHEGYHSKDKAGGGDFMKDKLSGKKQ